MDAIKSFSTVHSRHDHVEDNQVDAIIIFPDYIHRLLTILGDYDTIAQFFKHGLGNINDHILIVNQKNGFGSIGKSLFCGNLSIYCLVRYWQINVECGSVFNFAIDGDDAGVIFNDSICRG